MVFIFLSHIFLSGLLSGLYFSVLHFSVWSFALFASLPRHLHNASCEPLAAVENLVVIIKSATGNCLAPVRIVG